MGIIRFIFVTSIVVVLSAVVMQKYAPETVDKLVVVYHRSVRDYSVEYKDLIDNIKSVSEKYVNILYKTVALPVITLLMPQEKENNAQESAEPQAESKKTPKVTLMTKEELKEFDGSKGDAIYLSFMGHIFDVSKAPKFYGPGGGYGFFSGIDASRAFVSGQFDADGLIDDIEGLSYQDYLGLDDWLQFYMKDYTFVGKLIGRYFDGNGEPTEYKLKADKWLLNAKKEREAKEEEKKIFPSCNSEWSQEKGARVWCTTKSGGIDRAWTGVPRMLFLGGGNNSRCVCVKDSGAPSTAGAKDDNRGDLDHPHIREYKGCDPKAISCYIPKEE